MSTPKKSKAPAESLELYEKLVATNPDGVDWRSIST
jgi:hypothetical protein